MNWLLSSLVVSGSFKPKMEVAMHKARIRQGLWQMSAQHGTFLKRVHHGSKICRASPQDGSFSSLSGIGQIVDNVAESIQWHTSYLNAPKFIFSLCDEKSSAIDRQMLASALWSIPRPDTSPSYFKAGMVYAVPLLCSKKEFVCSPFCVIETGGLYTRKTLASLVSFKSYMMFNLMENEDFSWLIAPVALWNCMSSSLLGSFL